jgi:hypothetical protein
MAIPTAYGFRAPPDLEIFRASLCARMMVR